MTLVNVKQTIENEKMDTRKCKMTLVNVILTLVNVK